MLTGKNAIITGGNRGIGKSIAQAFCQQGANVLIVYRSNDEECQKTMEELAQFGTKVESYKGDVGDPKTAKEAVEQCKKNWGTVDILVNNAGMVKDKLLLKMKEEDFTSVIDANLNGAFYFLKEAAKIMMKQKSGNIINLSSVSGLYGNPAQVNYSASKAGIIGMTKSAAKELGRRNIRVNAIAPGFIETDMTALLSTEQKESASKNIPLGRLGQPEDIGKTALFLASSDSGYITGQIIEVSGGLTI